MAPISNLVWPQFRSNLQRVQARMGTGRLSQEPLAPSGAGLELSLHSAMNSKASRRLRAPNPFASFGRHSTEERWKSRLGRTNRPKAKWLFFLSEGQTKLASQRFGLTNQLQRDQGAAESKPLRVVQISRQRVRYQESLLQATNKAPCLFLKGPSLDVFRSLEHRGYKPCPRCFHVDPRGCVSTQLTPRV